MGYACVGLGPVGIRRDVIAKPYITPDSFLDRSKTAGGCRGHGGATDDAAFRFFRRNDRHAVNARLDLQPELGFGGAAGKR